jgi:hypothetical protein
MKPIHLPITSEDEWDWQAIPQSVRKWAGAGRLRITEKREDRGYGEGDRATRYRQSEVNGK